MQIYIFPILKKSGRIRRIFRGNKKNIDLNLYLGTNEISLENIDLIIKSPGIPLDLDVFKRAEEKNIEIVTDLELAYRIKPDANFIAITGTNGKTTTTTLTGGVF